MAKWAAEPNSGSLGSGWKNTLDVVDDSLAEEGAAYFQTVKDARKSFNTSGIHPAEFNVLIKLDPVAEKTAGGLHLPGNAVEREKFGSTKGTLLESAPLAFNADVWPSDMAPPSPGQRVLIAKHSGVTVKGDDDEEYRIVKDKDVVALLG